MRIRDEQAGDAEGIDEVIREAFSNSRFGLKTEPEIVRELRRLGELTISLVAVDTETDRMIGQVAVSPVTLSDDSPGWYGLGPISVLPEFRRQGIGSELMRQALRELRDLGAAGCVLVGDPRFYSRFGFKTDPRLSLDGVPPEVFLVLPLQQEGTAPQAKTRFSTAFTVQN